MRILVVDPQPSGYDGLLRAAAAERHEVLFFATGRAALRRRRELLGGLVIIGCELPDFNGFDLVEMLQPFPKGTAVLLVADQYAVEDELRAQQLGVGSYLCKPLDGSVLRQCRSIQRALRTCRYGDNHKGGKEVSEPRAQASTAGQQSVI